MIKVSHTDKIASVLLLLLTGVVFFLTADFPSGYGATSPAFFPRLIVSLIAVFAIVQLIDSFRADEVRSYEITPSVAVTVGIAAGLVVAYVFLMVYLGFLLGTAVFLVASMQFSGVDRIWKSVTVSVGVSLALYYIFYRFLRVPLPENPFIPIGRLLPSLWYSGVGLA